MVVKKKKPKKVNKSSLDKTFKSLDKKIKELKKLMRKK